MQEPIQKPRIALGLTGPPVSSPPEARLINIRSLNKNVTELISRVERLETKFEELQCKLASIESETDFNNAIIADILSRIDPVPEQPKPAPEPQYPKLNETSDDNPYE